MFGKVNRNQPILVCGGGGFIGGHLVSEMKTLGYKNIVSVDKKPLDEWYQVHRDVTNIGGPKGDLMSMENCRRVMKGARARRCISWPRTWAGWGSSRRTRPSAC